MVEIERCRPADRGLPREHRRGFGPRLAGDDVLIEVDGGIGTKTAGSMSAAGATLLVAGSAVFGAEDPAKAYAEIAAAAESGV